MERGHKKDLHLDERIILNWIFEKEGGFVLDHSRLEYRNWRVLVNMIAKFRVS
jgi:hypothetical protein